MPRTPVLVDTDMALDDWMALAYLLRVPDADVRAITLAATGEAHAGPGVKNARRLLTLADAPPIDVAAGRRSPLAGTNRFPLLVRLIMDLRFGLSLPKPRPVTPGSTHAVDVLARHLAAAETPVTMVSLGPLTNLAELFTRHPELTPRVAMLYVMGGALDVPGNIREITPKSRNVSAEWNVFIDPHAASVVLRSGVPITLVPLDATNPVIVTDPYLETLATEGRTPAAGFVVRVLRRIRPLLTKERPFCFWDPLTAVLALHPEIGTYRTRVIRVVEAPGDEQGRLVDDPDGTPIRVCEKVDRDAFESLFLAGLNGVARPPLAAAG